MAILDRILPWRKKSPDNFEVLRQLIGGNRSTAGKNVTVQNAIEVATVFACIRVIAEGIAQVPLKIMKDDPKGRTKLPVREHPLYDVLAVTPNKWQTSFEYRESLAMHIALAGEHFSFKNIGAGGRILELIPFEPGQVTVHRGDDFTLSYEIRAANGNTNTFPAGSIWHVRGPSWNTWTGLRAVKIAREAIGLSSAIEEQQAKFQRNGVKPSGVYSVEGTLNTDQYKKLADWIDENISGSENSGKVLLLDRAAKWLNTQMTGVDAQTLETRKYQVEEICRFFRVNPIMVGAESKNTTYASAEQMFLAHVVHTLTPWFQRIEQSIDANLLTKEERRRGLFSSFIDEGLLRGSLKDKHALIRADVNGGIMTPNEGRAVLDMNPDADPQSDKLRVPANITGSEADAGDAQDKPLK